MSLEALLHLREDHAFDPAPLRADLRLYHVPFDELAPPPRVEGELRRAAWAPERVAIMGVSGSGKSSVVESVLGPLAPGIAPIRIPVAAESDETVTNPQAFVQHLVRTVTRHAAEAALISESEREEILRSTGDRIHSGRREVIRRVGVPNWLLGGTLAAEVRSTGEAIEHRRSASDVIEEAARLIDLIRAHDLLPILVIDDSDAWLNIPGIEDRSVLVGAFFGRVVRVLADFKCGLVVAVHRQYRRMPGYRAVAGFLETTISLPELPDAAALARILERRHQAHGVSARVEEIWEDAAVEDLMTYYRGGAKRSLRKVMQVAHSALHHATLDGSERILRRFVDTAMSEWS